MIDVLLESQYYMLECIQRTVHVMCAIHLDVTKINIQEFIYEKIYMYVYVYISDEKFVRNYESKEKPPYIIYKMEL